MSYNAATEYLNNITIDALVRVRNYSVPANQGYYWLASSRDSIPLDPGGDFSKICEKAVSPNGACVMRWRYDMPDSHAPQYLASKMLWFFFPCFWTWRQSIVSGDAYLMPYLTADTRVAVAFAPMYTNVLSPTHETIQYVNNLTQSYRPNPSVIYVEVPKFVKDWFVAQTYISGLDVSNVLGDEINVDSDVNAWCNSLFLDSCWKYAHSNPKHPFVGENLTYNGMRLSTLAEVTDQDVALKYVHTVFWDPLGPSYPIPAMDVGRTADVYGQPPDWILAWGTAYIGPFPADETNKHTLRVANDKVETKAKA